MGISLAIGLVCGLIAAAIASSKGRSAIGWFFGGFLLGIVGVIIVACLSNRKEEQAYRASADREQRRLREQLRQERLKNEAFRQHATHRLDTHDQSLGVDTRSTPGLPGQGPSGLPGLPPAFGRQARIGPPPL